MYRRIGCAPLLQSRIDDAIVWFEKAHGDNPERSDVHAYPHRPMPAKAIWIAPSPNSPRPGDWLPTIVFQASLPEGCWIHRIRVFRVLGCAEDPRLVRSHYFRRARQGRNGGGIPAGHSRKYPDTTLSVTIPRTRDRSRHSPAPGPCSGPENCRNRLIWWQSEMTTAVLPMRVITSMPNSKHLAVISHEKRGFPRAKPARWLLFPCIISGSSGCWLSRSSVICP